MNLVSKFYYWLRPGELKKKMKREAAERAEEDKKDLSALLWEFEQLELRRGKLKKLLRKKAERLREFASIIDDARGGDAYEKRSRGYGNDELVSSFDIGRLGTYEEIRELAVELENIDLRLDAIKDELWLYGIEKGDDDV